MLFNSYTFVLCFLPLALIGYYALGNSQKDYSRGFLLLMSLLFYMWWNPVYIVLLASSIGFNFICAKQLVGDKSHRKWILTFAIASNVAFLGYFKYADFFLSNANNWLGTEFPLLNIVLPLAISFFTLQQIAFLVDVYEGLVEERSFKRYALFVSFFPQLIAGPIVHHDELMPQLNDKNHALFNHKNFALGLFIFSVGLFKKVVIADSFAPFVEAGFDGSQPLSALGAHMANMAYLFQVYFDFSGYSDMAVGLGLLFNISLPINFNSPYKATSIINFWQRWHMTLTAFINAYLYMPLIRLSKSFSFSYSMFVTVLVMAIVGLWHGAGWNYVLFGTMHGVALAVNHIWQRFKMPMPAWLGWLLTMGWFYLSLIAFRSDKPEKGMRVLEAMWNMESGGLSKSMMKSLEWLDWAHQGTYQILLMVIFVLLMGACLILKNPHQHREKFLPSKKYFVLTLLAFCSSLLFMNRVVEFIYFQF